MSVDVGYKLDANHELRLYPDQVFEIYGFDYKDTYMFNDYNMLTFGGEFERSTMKGKANSPQSASVNYFALFVQYE